MFEKMKIAKTCATQGFAGGGQPLESKKAFTLAETLITLTILGVVAAITVPMLINKQMEAANRTKLKKAMAAYEKALNQMIVDNDIKGTITAVEGFRLTDNCSGSRPYFKAIKEIAGNNCRFQTADKVWWDITDIEHPVISLKDQLTDAMVTGVKSNSDDYKDDKTLFSMTGEITNGIVRINDQADTGLSTEAKANLDKIYAFLNSSSSVNINTNNVQTLNTCVTSELGYDICALNMINNVSECENGVNSNCWIKGALSRTYYDENGLSYLTTRNDNDDDEFRHDAVGLYTRIDFEDGGYRYIDNKTCNYDTGECELDEYDEYSVNEYHPLSNGGKQIATKSGCNFSNGDNCTWIDELYEYDANGNVTLYMYNCNGTGTSCMTRGHNCRLTQYGGVDCEYYD